MRPPTPTQGRFGRTSLVECVSVAGSGVRSGGASARALLPGVLDDLHGFLAAHHGPVRERRGERLDPLRVLGDEPERDSAHEPEVMDVLAARQQLGEPDGAVGIGRGRPRLGVREQLAAHRRQLGERRLQPLGLLLVGSGAVAGGRGRCQEELGSVTGQGDAHEALDGLADGPPLEHDGHLRLRRGGVGVDGNVADEAPAVGRRLDRDEFEAMPQPPGDDGVTRLVEPGSLSRHEYLSRVAGMGVLAREAVAIRPAPLLVIAGLRAAPGRGA